MAEIQALSKAVVLVARLGIAGLGATLCWAVWQAFDQPRSFVEEAVDVPVIAPPADLALGVATAIVALPMLAMIGVLWRVQHLFAWYGAGEVLAPQPARHIRSVGIWILIAALLSVLSRPLLSVLLTMGNPAGQRALSVSFSSTDFALVLAGGVMLVLGQVLHHASVVAAENKAFV